MIIELLTDALFAALAAIGFGAISNPPARAFSRIAILAAVGHSLRFFLMNYVGLDIATSSLFAALTIGMGSLWLGRGARCPMTVLYIPALLPMIPGIYAYRIVFALVMLLQSAPNSPAALHYMQEFFFNSILSFSIIFMLAAGATMPIFIFKHRAFSLTRIRAKKTPVK